MRNFFLLFLSAFIIVSNSFGQSSNEKQKLFYDSIIRIFPIVLFSEQPKLKFDSTKISNYILKLDNTKYRETSKQILVELSEAIKIADTTKWTNKELSSLYVIDDINNQIVVDSFVNKLKFIYNTKQQKLKLKKTAILFNKTKRKDRIRNFIARPIFTSDGNFAMLQHQNDFGGEIILFAFDNFEWKRIAQFEQWLEN
jgi:hypothetical protein